MVLTTHFLKSTTRGLCLDSIPLFEDYSNYDNYCSNVFVPLSAVQFSFSSLVEDSKLVGNNRKILIVLLLVVFDQKGIGKPVFNISQQVDSQNK